MAKSRAARHIILKEGLTPAAPGARAHAGKILQKAATAWHSRQ
ncbi:hypothetical protein BRAS3809_550024 [Bradyrhizobium sp. STM 3809]|nr:hypothetical protein BRAS3809_550024 [Bradyrhizobium sp. STM 3809]